MDSTALARTTEDLTLAQRVAIIERAETNIEREFYTIGQQLWVIRETKQYEDEGYFSFEDFCQRCLRRTYERARQLIQAYKAVENSPTTVGEFSTIENEWQARNLLHPLKPVGYRETPVGGLIHESLAQAIESAGGNLDDLIEEEETAGDLYDEDSPEYQFGHDYSTAVSAQHAGFSVALPDPTTYGLPEGTEVEIIGIPWSPEDAADFRVQVPEDAAPLPHVAHNSGDNEWYTPAAYIEAACTVLGEIDLDPASSLAANDVINAETFYTAEDSGLTKRWAGRVWMNPPYAGELIAKFTSKLCAHFLEGEVTEAIVLVNNATETGWFQEMARLASAICFPKGRVKFWHPEKESAPLQGQAILYFGSQAIAFQAAFINFGFVATL